MAASQAQTDKIIEALTDAYWSEIETVMNYIANSEHLDGIRAKHIKTALAADVMEELGHAQQLAKRIKTIGGPIPGSEAFKATQGTLQPPSDSTDVVSVIKGVIDAERGAIKGYERMIEVSGDADPVTEDLAISLMSDEQEHLREFLGFLKEFEASHV